MSDHVKSFIDSLSLATAFASLVAWLPPLAALASLVWTLIRIYDWHKQRRAAKCDS